MPAILSNLSRPNELPWPPTLASKTTASCDTATAVVGIDFADLAEDGCVVTASAAARPRAGPGGPPNVRRQTLLLDGNGIPVGTMLAAANRHDSPPLTAAHAGTARPVRLPPASGDHRAPARRLRLGQSPRTCSTNSTLRPRSPPGASPPSAPGGGLAPATRSSPWPTRSSPSGA